MWRATSRGGAAPVDSRDHPPGHRHGRLRWEDDGALDDGGGNDALLASHGNGAPVVVGAIAPGNVKASRHGAGTSR